jgi:Bifunctional DNA primase/polymerase, N-terminal
MVDPARFDAITKLFEDFAASSHETLDRAPLFEPWKDWPRSGTPEAIALQYTMRDRHPPPVPYRQKKPIGNDWQHRVITGSQVHRFFGDKPQNIGVQLGPKSCGLTDVDLDCAEAIEIAAAITATLCGMSHAAALRFYDDARGLDARHSTMPTVKAPGRGRGGSRTPLAATSTSPGRR